MSFCLSYCLATLLLCLHTDAVKAALDLGLGSDDDLFHYVSRPDLKPPRLNVTKYYSNNITPGYWLLAPYASIVQERFPRMYHQTCQTGPTIYDQDGELVWSGACMFRNQNTCDFRTFSANGTNYLSAILTISDGLDSKGRAVILDESLQVIATHRVPDTHAPFNMHEFKVIEDGTKAVHLMTRTDVADITDIEDTALNAGLIVNMAAREFNLASGKTTFEWWMHPSISLNHSNAQVAKKFRGPFPEGWDWIHMNAVDKNDEGDYMLTARYTDAVYKVSGRDKALTWTLGGARSDFILEGFNVSGPHDARFIRREGEIEYITFLDNGGDEQRVLANTSTAYLLALDQTRTPWVARVVSKWSRPDGGRSDKRGNFQLLPNGNAFVGWSENSYISEHHPDGRFLMEAQFASKRFVTYRAYLANFTAKPAESPMMRAFAYGDNPEESMSVYYVSWNGGMGVTAWEFVDTETGVVIGVQRRRGFETMYSQSRVFVSTVFARAIAADGTVMRRSSDVVVERPPEWPARAEFGTKRPRDADASLTAATRDEL